MEKTDRPIEVDGDGDGASERSRGWALARAAKEAYWRSLKPSERLRLADELRRHALLLHPEWPTAEQRARDYAAHVRLSACLDRAATTCKR